MTELQREYVLAERADKRNAEILRQKLLKKVGWCEGRHTGRRAPGKRPWTQLDDRAVSSTTGQHSRHVRTRQAGCLNAACAPKTACPTPAAERCQGGSSGRQGSQDCARQERPGGAVSAVWLGARGLLTCGCWQADAVGALACLHAAHCGVHLHADAQLAHQV